MAKITVLGGTGYTGTHIVHEASARRHSVTSFSRTVPEEDVSGVLYEAGSLLDDAVRTRAVAGADVVIAALSPRGELDGELLSVYSRIAELAAQAGARLGVVGGFSSLRPAAGAPRFAEGDDLPPQFADEGRAMAVIIEKLIASAPEPLDWFFISPAATYGAHAPGSATGTYRTGDDVALFDAAGNSAISGTDFAKAIIDEIETPTHHRRQFSVAY